MTVSLQRPVTKEKIEKALEEIQVKTVGDKPTLRSYFGTLKRGIDPLVFQNQIRNEWD